MLQRVQVTTRPDPAPANAYPWHLVERCRLPDGTAVTIRPIRAGDIEIEAAFAFGLSKESRYQRLHSARKLLPGELERLTDIRYDREMALIATLRINAVERQIGVARYVVDQDRESAEMAIVVADAWQRRGLGERLLRHLLAAASDAGLKRLTGVTLATNNRMLALASKLGFRLYRDPVDATVTHVLKAL